MCFSSFLTVQLWGCFWNPGFSMMVLINVKKVALLESNSIKILFAFAQWTLLIFFSRLDSWCPNNFYRLFYHFFYFKMIFFCFSFFCQQAWDSTTQISTVFRWGTHLNIWLFPSGCPCVRMSVCPDVRSSRLSEWVCSRPRMKLTSKAKLLVSMVRP